MARPCPRCAGFTCPDRDMWAPPRWFLCANCGWRGQFERQEPEPPIMIVVVTAPLTRGKGRPKLSRDSYKRKIVNPAQRVPMSDATKEKVAAAMRAWHRAHPKKPGA